MSISDVLRRGLDNTLANWQLILIRISESILLGLICVGVAFAAIIPLLLSLGITTLSDPETLAASIVSALAAAWLVLVYVFAIIVVLVLIVMMIHSFFEAGCARIYIDGERAAGAAAAGGRTRFRAYTFNAWWEGAKDGWWTIFWIYNLVWSVAALILLVPLIPTIAAMLIFRNQEAVLACAGCFGLVVMLVLAIPVTIVASVWTQKAIVVAMARNCAARDATRTAWAEVRLDMMRHVMVALALLAISFVGSSIFGGISSGLSFAAPNARMVIALMPIRITMWVLSTAFGSAVGGWLLAAFAALSVDRGTAR
ncbi:MAG TPA: hypothetical protein VN181_07285 [Thermoanaerobaculia bacterium]|nr:hypothetical protein [Thermoanaerobaculia bacterium]